MTMSRSWALTHRNESSLGLDLRHPEGADLFGRLVAGADAVFANFKPGTLASLGFSYDTSARAQSPHRAGRKQRVRGDRAVERPDGLRAAGPRDHRRHLAVDLRGRESRGSFLRCHHHISRPRRRADHRDRRAGGAGQPRPHRNRCARAYLTGRSRGQPTRHGIRHRSRPQPRQLPVADDTAIHGVYPCDGDDEWCVISVRSDDDRAALAAAMGRDELPRERADLIAAVSEWTAAQDKIRCRRRSAASRASPRRR